MVQAQELLPSIRKFKNQSHRRWRRNGSSTPVSGRNWNWRSGNSKQKSLRTHGAEAISNH
jgi:hypothetical protein